MLFPRSAVFSLFLIIFFFTNKLPGIASTNVDSVTSNKRKIFFYWGYNRSFYSKSDIHFNGPNYDFTLYDLTAHDRPTPFDLSYFNPTRLSIPQYNIRGGYFLTDRFAISLGWDHMKYVVDQFQTALISGVISPDASPVYAGSYLNQPIELTYEFLKFEHTDGFNLISLDMEYLHPLAEFFKRRAELKWNVGIGGIWVVTRTDVTVFKDSFNNDFHIAGFSMQAKAGPRLEIKNKYFLSAEFKTGYVTLPWVLIKNEAPENAGHNLIFYEVYVVGGVYLNVVNKLFKRKARA